MAIPEIAINHSQLYELGKHSCCELSMDEYLDSTGTKQICIECETCGKVLVILSRRKK